MYWWSTDGRAQLEYDPDSKVVSYTIFDGPNAQDRVASPEGEFVVHLDDGSIWLNGFSEADCKAFFDAIRYARLEAVEQDLERHRNEVQAS